MTRKNHSTAAYRKAMDLAKARVAETDPADVDPVAMAQELAGEVEGSIPTDHLADFIMDLVRLREAQGK